jgi:hypothetical protein
LCACYVRVGPGDNSSGPGNPELLAEREHGQMRETFENRAAQVVIAASSALVALIGLAIVTSEAAAAINERLSGA